MVQLSRETKEESWESSIVSIKCKTFHYSKVKVKSLSHIRLCDPVDCSPPSSSVHGILQARILEWVAISFTRGSSWPRDQTQVSHIAGRRFNLCATREAPIILNPYSKLAVLTLHISQAHLDQFRNLVIVPVLKVVLLKSTMVSKTCLARQGSNTKYGVKAKTIKWQ